MLKGNQKRYLKGLANPISHRYLLGKGEIDESFIAQIDAALEAKELIKVGLNSNCPMSPKDAGEILSAKTNSELVQVIGKVVVLYRRSKKAPKIVLPQ